MEMVTGVLLYLQLLWYMYEMSILEHICGCIDRILLNGIQCSSKCRVSHQKLYKVSYIYLTR